MPSQVLVAHSIAVADQPEPGRSELHVRAFTIFEGTSGLQPLIIARAISDIHIRSRSGRRSQARQLEGMGRMGEV